MLTWLTAPAPAAALVVYRLALPDFARHREALLGRLPAAEQQTAATYANLLDRLRFILSRAALRELLGQRLGLAPAAVAFGLSASGKPELLPPAGLHFNLAYAGDWLLLALAAQPVGIDVARANPAADVLALAARHFSPGAQQQLRAHPNPRRAFYRHWTHYEALVKADGRGGHAPTPPDLHAWTVRGFEVAAGYPAALAYPATWQPTLAFRNLTPSGLSL